MQSCLNSVPSRLACGSAFAAIVGDANSISAALLEHAGIDEAVHQRLVLRALHAAGLETVKVASAAVIGLTSLSVRTRVCTTRVHQAVDRSLSIRAEGPCTPCGQHESTHQRDKKSSCGAHTYCLSIFACKALSNLLRYNNAGICRIDASS